MSVESMSRRDPPRLSGCPEGIERAQGEMTQVKARRLNPSQDCDVQSSVSRLRQLFDRPELVLGLATLALHLWVNGAYGYFRDELYFIVCGRHLAWGYTDQPPLTPLIAWASDAAFHSLRGLRLVPALACAATVALTAHAARRAWRRALRPLARRARGSRRRRAAGLRRAAHDGFAAAARLARDRALHRQSRTDGEPRWLLAAGAIAGVAFLAKYTVALFLVSLGLGLLATPQRLLLARWQAWAGGLLALAVAAPNLVWQAANGWPFVAHTAVLAAEKNIPLSPGSFLLQEVLTPRARLGPGLDRRGRGLRLLAGFRALALGRGQLGRARRRRRDRAWQALLSRARLSPADGGRRGRARSLAAAPRRSRLSRRSCSPSWR